MQGNGERQHRHTIAWHRAASQPLRLGEDVIPQRDRSRYSRGKNQSIKRSDRVFPRTSHQVIHPSFALLSPSLSTSILLFPPQPLSSYLPAMLALLVFAFAALSALASPLPKLQSRSTVISNGITKDAPYTLSTPTLDSMAVQCPNGVQKKASKNILFVHGTGGTGSESWASGLVPAFYAKG